MKKKFEIYWMLVAFLWLVSCGGGSGGNGGETSIPVAPPLIKPAGLHILSGDNQVGLIGEQLAQPLTVGVYDDEGNPVRTTVNFSVISGAGALTAWQVETASDGSASTKLKVNGDVEEIKVRASVAGVGEVVFTATPRLPILNEVLDASVEGEEVALLPVVLGELDNGQRVLVLLRGKNPSIDLTMLPLAVELAGGTIDGVPALDYPVVFVSSGVLSASTVSNLRPATGEITSHYLAGVQTNNLHAVSNLLVNGAPAVVGILGDDGSKSATTLGELIQSGATVDYNGEVFSVANLPVYFVPSDVFPVNPAVDNYSYMALQSVSAPLFSSIEQVSGATARWVGVATLQIPTVTTYLMPVSGGLAPFGLQLYNVPPLVEKTAPKTALTPLPIEFLDIVNIIESDLAPLLGASQPQLEEISQLIEQISSVVQQNSELIRQLMNGEITNPLALAGIATQILPSVDQLLENYLLLLPNIDEMLSVVEDELLPAILDALPEDGVVFGGYSDGEPSTIANDVIPSIQAHIDNLQSAMPFIQNLLADLEALIPDDGNIYTLMLNLLSGGLTNIVNDLNDLLPFVVTGLEIFYEQNIPILFDMLEEAEHNYPAGESPLSETMLFQMLVSNLTAIFPPGTTLGDIPALQDILPAIDEMLPDEYGNPAEWDIYEDILPMLGSVDIGADILPALRDALEELNAQMPQIIAQVASFNFWELISKLPFIPGL